jgi:hypothetical protein
MLLQSRDLFYMSHCIQNALAAYAMIAGAVGITTGLNIVLDIFINASLACLSEDLLLL